MGGYLNIPEPLTTSPPLSPSPSPSQPLAPPQRPNIPLLYYGLAVVATAALVLAFYNLIIVRWCTTTIQNHRRLQQQNNLSRRRGRSRQNPASGTTSSSLTRDGHVCLSLKSSFKYEKGTNKNISEYYNTDECSVCLSVFEEGEEVRKLPICGHCFHASCIDMWLYSHFDCPLCRAPVVEPPPPPPHAV